MFARPTPDRTSIAETLDHFYDTFSQTGGETDSDREPDYWTAVTPAGASLTEASNLMTFAADATAYNAAEMHGKVDYRLDFFSQPVRIELTDLLFTGAGTASEHKFTLWLASTQNNHWDTPSAVKLWMLEQKRVSLSFKTNDAEENPENVSEPVDNTGNGDLTAWAAIPKKSFLTLDRTSYHLEVQSTAESIIYSGLHGLTAPDWGNNFYLGLEGLTNSATPTDVTSYTLSEVRHKALLAFDAFRSVKVTDSGSIYRQYIVDESNTDTSPVHSSGALVLTADGTGATREAFVTSRVSNVTNPFAQQSTMYGDLAFSGTAAAGKQVFKCGYVSEQATPTDSTGAVEVHIADNGAWAIYQKAQDAALDPSTLTAVASGTGATVTDFQLEHDEDRVKLVLGGANTITSALTIAITSISQAADGAVVTATNHGLSVGNIVEFADVAGMTELNGTRHTVKTENGTTGFTIEQDTTGYGAHTASTGTIDAGYAHGFRTTADASVTNPAYKFGVAQTYNLPGDAGYYFCAERDENTAATAVVSLSNFRIERDTDEEFQNTVFGTVGDGINVSTPKRPRSQYKMPWGIADVTKAPFHADPTGVLDSTAAIQRAIAFAFDHNMVAFFPEGTYLVSDSLSDFQKRRTRTGGQVQASLHSGSVRIQGSHAGVRPTIKLAAGSLGFSNTAQAGRKPVLEIYAHKNGVVEDDPWRFNQNDAMSIVIDNIHIEVGASNSGAIGLRAPGSQACSVQNVSVDLTASGYTCFEGGNGAGSSMLNVTATGGKFGFDFSDAQRPKHETVSRNPGGSEPGTTLRCCIAEEQTLYPIKMQHPSPLVLVGCEINIPTGTFKGIYNPYSSGSWYAHNGQICAVDTKFTFETYHASNIAIDTGASVFLKNVYVYRAEYVVDHTTGAVDNSGAGSPTDLATGTTDWIKVTEFCSGAQPPAYTSGEGHGTDQFENPLFVDGVRQFTAISTSTNSGISEPTTLRTDRLPTLPNWEATDAVSVLDYGAVGDGVTDCTTAFTNAIAAAALTTSQVVFIPKGYFLISSTIDLTGDVKLKGVHHSCSQLIVRADFSVAGAIIRTANSATAAPAVVDLTLHSPDEVTNVYCLQVRSGLATVWNVRPEDRSAYGYGATPGKPSYTRRAIKLIQYTDNGGGYLGNIQNGTHWAQLAGSRVFYAEALTNDLDITMLNPEHTKADAMAEINACSGHIEIFGTKAEGAYCIIWYSNGSTNFEQFGIGGNFTGVPPAEYVKVDWGDAGGDEHDYNGGTNPAPSDLDYTLAPCPVRIDAGCNNYRITNLSQTGEVGSTYSNNYVKSFDPAAWNILYDGDKTESPTDLVAPLDFPVQYKRGTPPS